MDKTGVVNDEDKVQRKDDQPKIPAPFSNLKSSSDKEAEQKKPNTPK